VSWSWTVLLRSSTHRNPIMTITAVLLAFETYLLTLPSRWLNQLNENSVCNVDCWQFLCDLFNESGRKRSWPNRDNILELEWGDWGKPLNTFVRIASVADGIQTEHFRTQVSSVTDTTRSVMAVSFRFVSYEVWTAVNPFVLQIITQTYIRFWMQKQIARYYRAMLSGAGQVSPKHWAYWVSKHYVKPWRVRQT
jgi:hypothetical protein